MNPLKTALGLGAACAACCAVPLLGIAGGFAASGSALLACAGDLLPPAVAILAVALAVATAAGWRRRGASRSATCACADTCPTQAPRVGP